LPLLSQNSFNSKRRGLQISNKMETKLDKYKVKQMETNIPFHLSLVKKYSHLKIVDFIAEISFKFGPYQLK
jgi:hypothetical protein